MPETHWYDDRANLVLMLDHMHASGYDVSELIRAVDKPWSYRGDFELAVAEQQLADRT